MRERTFSLNNKLCVQFVVQQIFQRTNSQHTWEQPVHYLSLVRPFTDLAQQSVGQIQVELMRLFFCQRLCEAGAGQELQQRKNQDGTEPRREFGVFGH